MDRAERFGRWAENALMTVLLSSLILLASSQILLRNVFSTSLGWGDELIRLIVLWLALIGAIAASRENKQIKIDVLTRALSGVPLRIARFATDAFTTAVTGLLAWHSWRFVQESRQFGDTILVDWPAWIFQLVLPVGFFMIAYRYLLRLLRNVTGHEK